MSILPPLLPELGLDGGRPAGGSVGPAAGTIRLGARVVGIAGAHLLIQTGHGRALLQGAPTLRPGVVLTLELQPADPAAARAGRLVAVGEQRLAPPLPVRLQPAPPTQAAATVRSATTLEVSLRVIGPDHRPATPAFSVRLAVLPPRPEPVAPGRTATMASPAGGAFARGTTQTGASRPADSALPANIAGAPVTGRPAAALPAGPSPATSNAGTKPSIAPGAILEQLGVRPAQHHPIEAIVLPRDALGRALLRAAGVTFQVDTPVELPVGARLQLALPAGLAGSSAAPLQAGPLEAVRTLAASLREQPETEQPSNAGRLRLPEASASLAARLLRLVQLIAPRSGEANGRSPPEPATMEGQPGAARVAAALAELARLAGEPQSGGWRVLLLPLGFAGTPLLRLYVRDDFSEQDGGGDRQADRRPAARRAVFELEFSELGRAQVDVLCQARRFDLLVRTERTLSPRLRREIRELYLAAREVAGLVGEVRFRAGQWVALPEPTSAGGGITV